MCGFCGVLGAAARAGADDVEAMARTLTHRGPDDFGTWRARFRSGDEEHDVAFGHTRLAIVDLSPLGHQPMSTPDGALTIAFNGEIYNHRELRDELRAAGARFRSESDTEVLLEAWRAWGEDALPRLNGMFAFALWDAASRRLVLARDPIGIKPLYWSHRDGVLTFGSELKALRRHRAFQPAIDRGALGRFLRHGYVPGPETIYAGVRCLLPGQLLVWERGKIALRPFWRITDPPESKPPERFEDVVDTLDELLGDAVERQMISDVPLGAFLSGGVDSSTVVALMQERARQPVRTFSIGFRETGWDEAPFARSVAEHLKTDHTELYVTAAQAVDAARELPDLYDEPFADASAIPTVLLSRLTRQHVTVALSGDGGDELFGGYAHYPKFQRLRPWLAVPRPLRLAGRALAPVFAHGRVRNALRHLGGADPAEVAYSLVSEYGEPQLAAAVGPEGARPAEEFLNAFRAAAVDGDVRRLMVADARTYLPGDILVKVDRASMSVALEARVPILDYRIVRFALALPLATIWQGGRTKAPLREVLYRRVPRTLIDRPKHGFGIPVHMLLQLELREWAERHLTPARLAEDGILDPAGVAGLRASIERHPDARTRTEVVWRLVCFQRWFARTHRGEAL